ncbi:MAG: hypothetical protein ACT4QF_13925 [Sporichthyaceae bacterium]
MTPEQRSADGLTDVAARVEPRVEPPLLPPSSEVSAFDSRLLDAPLLHPDADLPISVPTTYLDYEEDYGYEQARARRRARAKAHQKMARLRLYSYFMTLAACVFALMAFMYLVQGQGDRDATFLTLGALFGAITVFLLWAAVRVTHVGEHELHH